MMRDFAGFRLGAATVLLAAPAAVQAAPAVAAAPVARPVAGISLDGLAVAEVLRLPWGSAAGSLGRRVPDEGNPECPSTLAADARGRVWILDQVNARVQVFVPGARRPQVIPLPADTFQDLAPDGRGGVAVLDRLVSRTISFVSASGQVERTLSVEGPGIPEGGGVTALFRHDDGWWLEYDHARVVRVAGSDGSPDTLRPALQGRRSPDGSRLFVGSVAGGAVTIGLSSFDREKYRLAPNVTIKLKDEDVGRAKQMLSYKWFDRPHWRREIEHMLKSGVKLELEALSNRGISFITEEYLPHKLRDREWVE